MSDTPRTDAMRYFDHDICLGVVPATFARELERESSRWLAAYDTAFRQAMENGARALAFKSELDAYKKAWHGFTLHIACADGCQYGSLIEHIDPMEHIDAAPQAGAEKLSEGTGTQRRDLESPCSPAAAAPNCAISFGSAA